VGVVDYDISRLKTGLWYVRSIRNPLMDTPILTSIDTNFFLSVRFDEFDKTYSNDTLSLKIYRVNCKWTLNGFWSHFPCVTSRCFSSSLTRK
jgi:hypothetical protein